MHENKCMAGDIVVRKDRRVSVSEVIEPGTAKRQWENNYGNTVSVAGRKAIISACRIMANGQVLTRSPKYIGDDWEHVS